MSVKVSTLDYENYGKCVCITNGVIEVYVSVDVGPRILRLAFVGKDNLLYNDINRISNKTSEGITKAFGDGAEYAFYGGHRLWASPEDPVYSYYPDGDPVKWQQTELGAIFTAKPQPVNDVQHSMEIKLSDGQSLEIFHSIKNLRNEPQTYASWGITQFNPGGIEIVPQVEKFESLTANRIISYWSYVNMDDERIHYGKDFITIKTHPTLSRLKIGFNNACKWSCYVNQGTAIIKEFDYTEGGQYPDFGCNYETYTDPYIMEMECVGLMTKVNTGECATHREKWTIKPVERMPSFTDQEDIANFVAEYIK